MDTIVIGGGGSSHATPVASTMARLHVSEVYDAASILGKTLSSLPVPLFTFEAYDAIVLEALKLEVSSHPPPLPQCQSTRRLRTTTGRLGGVGGI